MAKICLVGAGKLGARHLQAMRGFREAHTIFVVEPSEEARNDAKRIYESTEGQENEVYFLADLAEAAAITGSLDAAVVATGSGPRRAIVERMLELFTIDALILEKVLFQRTKDLDEIWKQLTDRGIKTWVNCPRRYFQVYRDLREELKAADRFQVSVSGSDWGLGCNGIHFIDLIAYLAGCAEAHICIDGLDHECIESKRRGYYEITGTICGNVGKCSEFSITSYKGGTVPNSVIITSDAGQCFVFEWAGKSIGVTSAREITEKQITIPFQSQLTNIVIEEILDTGDCGLTPYQESARLHKAFLEPLSAFFREQGFEEGLCPIT